MSKWARTLGLSALSILWLGMLLSPLSTHLETKGSVLEQREAVAAPFSALDGSQANLSAALSTHFNTVHTAARYTQAHAHLLNLCSLALLVAIAISRASLSPKWQRGLSIALCTGLVIYPLGLLLDGAGISLAGHACALIGSLAILASVLGVVIANCRIALTGRSRSSPP